MTEAVRLIRAEALAATPYAHAAVVPSGLVLTAGACPLRADGTVAGADVVGEQARVAMRNLETALAATGCSLADVVKTTVYVASDRRADLVEAWQVVTEAFGDHQPPSTLLGVAVLGYPDQLFEIEAVAALPQR